MPATEGPPQRYQFAPAVDLAAALTALEIEYLDVSAERAIVIYAQWILDFTVVEGHLSGARSVECDVLEQPPTTADEPAAIIESVIDRLATTTAANYRVSR